MCIVTEDGSYLSGQPDELLERLADRIHALTPDRDRVRRYRRTIGPEYAAFSARTLLDGLAEEGRLLIHPHR